MAPLIAVVIVGGIALSAYHLVHDVPAAYRAPSNPADIAAVAADLIGAIPLGAAIGLGLGIVSFGTTNCRVFGRERCHADPLPMTDAQLLTPHRGRYR